MKIGLVADIHGNYHALAAVLAALARQQVDIVLCAGDLVCYGAQPVEVIDTLRGAMIPAVAGNYDEAAGWNLPTAARKPSSPANEVLKQAALEWTRDQLDATARAYLRSLPRSAYFVLDTVRVALVHGGLDYTDEWITPDEPHALSRLAARLDADVVVLGHTHQAFVVETQSRDGAPVLAVNPGAVGRALDGDPRAAYALLDSSTRRVDLHRLEYDLAGAVEAIARSTMPRGIADLVRHGLRRIEQLPQHAADN